MSDDIADFVQDRDLGSIQRRIPLRGKLTLSGDLTAAPALVLTPRGVWIVAAVDAKHGVAVDLSERTDARYQVGRLTDSIVVGEVTLGVPRGSGELALESIALGRLRHHYGRAQPRRPVGRHIQHTSELEQAFLGAFLDASELVLAWLDTATPQFVGSHLLGDASLASHFLLTDRRAELVAVGPAGDVWHASVDASSLRATGRGRVELTAGDQHWQSTRLNGPLYLDIVSAAPLTGTDRVREVARLNWLDHSGDSEELGFARRLLDRARADGDASAALASWLISEELGEGESVRPSLADAVAQLRQASPPRLALATLWKHWQMTPRSGLALTGALDGLGAEPWALELHVAVRSELDGTPAELARADMALAEHMLAAGKNDDAVRVIETSLEKLPSEQLDALLPPSDADLTRGDAGQALRVGLYELLARARGSRESPDVAAVAELCRLEPLVLDRVRTLARLASGDLQARAKTVLGALEPGGLSARRLTAVLPSSVGALSREQIETVLRHPLAREGSAMLGRLQAMLASVPAPDASLLRSYVEQIKGQRQKDAAHALTLARQALGAPSVLAYVSRGAKAVGLRAFEGDPPFVLIGGRHLDAGDRFEMSPAELAFAIGSEVAHVRYGHSRVTSSEVWAGALDKSKQGLDLALAILPVLRGWRVADKVSKVAARIPAGPIKQVLNQASSNVKKRSLARADRASNEDVLSRVNEELVAAHRVMQLTADRAGLLLAQSLPRALRAILLTRADYRQLLEASETDGLDKLLGQRESDGKMTHQDLAVRVAALISFYLSDDFVRLSSTLREAPQS